MRTRRPSSELLPFLSSVFEELSKEALSELGNKTLGVRYKQGDLITQEGAPSTGVYIVYSGLVLIGKYSSSHKRRVLRFLAPGEFFGLEAMFMRGQDTHIQFARALLDSEIINIHSHHFLEFLKRHPRSLLNLCRWFAREVAMLEFKLTRDATEGSLQNLAMLLSALCHKYGQKTPQGILINLPLRRSLIAELLGISEDSLLKLLKLLKGRQIVGMPNSSILILDEKSLNHLALTTEFYLNMMEETL